MKQLFLFSILLLCACSCQKDVESILVGSWEVSVSYRFEDSDETYDSRTYKYVFLENGHCLISPMEDISNRVDYTYYHDKGNNAIVFEMTDRTSILEIESLSKDRFVLHGEGRAGGGGKYITLLYTYIGKKL